MAGSPNSYQLQSQPRSRTGSSSSRSQPPLPPEHFDDSDSMISSDEHEATEGLLGQAKPKRSSSKKTSRTLWAWFSPFGRRHPRRARARPTWARRGLQLLLGISALIGLWIVFTLLFGARYTASHMPASWSRIRESVEKGGGSNRQDLWTHLPGEGGREKQTKSGRGNPNNEKVYIAANIVNAELISSEWGPRVMELMDLLGEHNVFLSIFENDSGVRTKEALGMLDSLIAAHMPDAGRSIISTTLPFSGVPRTQIRPDESYIKRITYLAEVRNRALLPLLGSIPSLAAWHQPSHPPEPLTEASEAPLPGAPQLPPQYVKDPAKYARILFLNDVVFDPLQLLHLLFSTNDGNYATACGTDFINPFKFYDTFATRDVDGYNLGVPFFPYFYSSSPRSQVLSGSAAVEVGSCWGGAVAFNASYFTTSKSFVRFRSEPEPFWDASECCLINADITGHKFVNPFVRSAYDRATFNWLPFVRRIERLFVPVHTILGWSLGMPWGGARREEKVGDVKEELVWDEKKGSWVGGKRKAGRGGFCGGRKLLVMNEGPGENVERGWRNVAVPPGGPH